MSTMNCGGIEAVVNADLGNSDTILAVAHTEIPCDYYDVVAGYGEDMSYDARTVSIPPSSRVPSFGVDFECFQNWE